jgi:hypothetical protein
MPNTPDERFTILERAQETLERTQRLHTDILGSHADAHRDQRERMANLDEQHQA